MKLLALLFLVLTINAQADTCCKLNGEGAVDASANTCKMNPKEYVWVSGGKENCPSPAGLCCNKEAPGGQVDANKWKCVGESLQWVRDAKSCPKIENDGVCCNRLAPGGVARLPKSVCSHNAKTKWMPLGTECPMVEESGVCCNKNAPGGFADLKKGACMINSNTKWIEGGKRCAMIKLPIIPVKPIKPILEPVKTGIKTPTDQLQLKK